MEIQCSPFITLCSESIGALIRSYLRVPQAAGEEKILIFLVKIDFFPLFPRYANNFYDVGQVPILRYFETCIGLDHVISEPCYKGDNFIKEL